MFQFKAKIPPAKDLKIQVMDYDSPVFSELIGETEIDLEQRLLSRYHATCGLPKTYFTYVTEFPLLVLEPVVQLLLKVSRSYILIMTYLRKFALLVLWKFFGTLILGIFFFIKQRYEIRIPSMQRQRNLGEKQEFL